MDISVRYESMTSAARRVVSAVILVIVGATVACAEIPISGEGKEETTTWRAGDRIFYLAGCHSSEALAEMIVAYERGESAVDTPHCFVSTHGTPIPAVLRERVAGPFESRFGPLSIWQVHDAIGDSEFIILPDTEGPHEALQEA